MLSELWPKISAEVVVKAFSAAGIFPLNAEKPLKKLFPIQHEDEGTPAPFAELKESILETLFPSSSGKNRQKMKKICCGKVSASNNEQMTENSNPGSPRLPKFHNGLMNVFIYLDSGNCFKCISTKSRSKIASFLGFDVTKNVSFGSFSINSAPRRQHFTSGDGNCFFRAISFALSGTEELHGFFRKNITAHMKFLGVRIEEYMGTTVENYLRCSNMEKEGVWATDNEILASASLLNVDIVVYANYGSQLKWLRYPSSLCLDSHSNEAIFLSNESGVHFNVVLSA